MSAAIALDGHASKIPTESSSLIFRTSESYGARRGDKIEAITQYVRRGKKYFICSHGGGCYSAFVTVNGKATRSIRMDNCRVNFARSETSYGETIFYVDVDRRLNSPTKLRFNDVNDSLLNMGLCSACAGTAANAYVKRPSSPCGQLTRSALEGNPLARRKLISANNACTAEWRK